MSYTEENDMPADVLAHGTYTDKWVGHNLWLTHFESNLVPVQMVQMAKRFPGEVACKVQVTETTITVTIELE